MPKTSRPTVHYASSEAAAATPWLPCSGRSTSRPRFTTDPEEVTCGACLRTVRKLAEVATS